MRACGVVPARLESSRLARKLLLAETGKPLIQYCWEAARQAQLLSDVIVATDSVEIARAVAAFGGRCELTRQHPSGSDRVAEVAARCCPNADIIVNLQADEPEIDPRNIDRLVRALIDTPQADMATLAAVVFDPSQLRDPSCTKVVCRPGGQALYFSRTAIPYYGGVHQQALSRQHKWLLHLGVYAYWRDYLLQLARTPPSALERMEKLEQLRALEAGAWIQVAVVAHDTAGVDTEADYAKFVARQRRSGERQVPGSQPQANALSHQVRPYDRASRGSVR